MSDGPWVDVPHLWKDEKAYMNWLRSQTRRMWSRHPVKNEFVKSKRFKAPLGRNGREVWCVECVLCNNDTNKFEVDHITPGGSFHDWKSYTEWSKRILWVRFEDLRLLCLPCHQLITYCDKYGLSLEEGAVEKEVIQKIKQKATDQKKELLSLGFTAGETRTAEMRRECYRKHYRGDPK